MSAARPHRLSPDAHLDPAAAESFAACIRAGGTVVFPADTVYGLACDPCNADAVRRLYELKGRPPRKPAAVMFFALAPALAALPELGPRTSEVLRQLLPGGLTVLLANPRERFSLACATPEGQPSVLGLRVPRLSAQLLALGAVELPVMQSSANLSGQPEARHLRDVNRELRAGADLVLDGGELPGEASTVIDLTAYEQASRWRLVREGPVGARELQAILGRAPDV